MSTASIRGNADGAGKHEDTPCGDAAPDVVAELAERLERVITLRVSKRRLIDFSDQLIDFSDQPDEHVPFESVHFVDEDAPADQHAASLASTGDLSDEAGNASPASLEDLTSTEEEVEVASTPSISDSAVTSSVVHLVPQVLAELPAEGAGAIDARLPSLENLASTEVEMPLTTSMSDSEKVTEVACTTLMIYRDLAAMTPVVQLMPHSEELPAEGAGASNACLPSLDNLASTEVAMPLTTSMSDSERVTEVACTTLMIYRDLAAMTPVVQLMPHSEELPAEGAGASNACLPSLDNLASTEVEMPLATSMSDSKEFTQVAVTSGIQLMPQEAEVPQNDGTEVAITPAIQLMPQVEEVPPKDVTVVAEDTLIGTESNVVVSDAPQSGPRLCGSGGMVDGSEKDSRVKSTCELITVEAIKDSSPMDSEERWCQREYIGLARFQLFGGRVQTGAQTAGLIAMRQIVTKQLPIITPQYATSLLFEPYHRSLLVIYSGIIAGGAVYRLMEYSLPGSPDTKARFAELAFLTVAEEHQLSGLGTRIMNVLKGQLLADKCDRIMTYADHLAIGFFRQQGFTPHFTLPSQAYVGRIKQYDHAHPFECVLQEQLPYLSLPHALRGCRRDIIEGWDVAPRRPRAASQLCESSNVSDAEFRKDSAGDFTGENIMDTTQVCAGG